MTLRMRFESLTSSAGDKIVFPDRGVTCVVGGNNAGKSQLLRDLLNQVAEYKADPITLTDLTISRPKATREEALEWLDLNALKLSRGAGSQTTYQPVSGSVDVSIDDFLRHIAPSKNALMLSSSAFFVRHSSAGSLTKYASETVSSPGIYRGTSPLSALYSSGGLEEELSELCFNTFGLRLTLDRLNTEVRLRVGAVDVPVPPINRPTIEYADAVSRMPSLNRQGDGVKSFVGLALMVLAETPNVLLLDEPEAFLHPGQARALGRWLAAEAMDRDIQVVVATHDRDVVLGLIEGGAAAPVNIVRIVREGPRKSRLAQLAPEQVQSVWSDPVLRYSNVLQGLFHKRVVICEADADCRFYGAALDHLGASTERRSEVDDVLMVPSGGKQRVAAIARALTSLEVEARAIVDFDVLKSKSDVVGIVQAVGAVWSSSIESRYKNFSHWANQSSAWPNLKTQGMTAVAPGATYTSAVELLEMLSEAGVHVVPVGEMEGYDRGVGLHGAAWVSSALERSIHSGSAQVQDLVSKLL